MAKKSDMKNHSLSNCCQKNGEKNMARRGENIFKRKDGRWEARVIECRSNGKRVYRSLYGKTYTEAKAKKKSITA